MSKLQEKLRENKNKINREKFLAKLDATFSEFVANAEFSNDLSCIKNAAFPMWDGKAGVLRTTRGPVKNWNNFTFTTWNELITALSRFQHVKNYIGWFFADKDGPYFKVSVNAFLAHIQSVASYGIANEHFDFGWVGAEDDVGILIEYDHASPRDKKFAISMWGL